MISFPNAFHILVFHLGMRYFFVWLWLHKQDGTILIVKVEQKKLLLAVWIPQSMFMCLVMSLTRVE